MSNIKSSQLYTIFIGGIGLPVLATLLMNLSGSVGSLLVFACKYILYLVNLVLITSIFVDRVRFRRKHSLKIVWVSLLLVWTVFWDFSVPHTLPEVFSLLKAISYLIIVLGYHQLIFHFGMDFQADSRSPIVNTVLLTIIAVNFFADNIGSLGITSQNVTLIQIAVSPLFIFLLLFVGLISLTVHLHRIQYIHPLLYEAPQAHNSKQTSIYSVVFISVLGIMSLLVLLNKILPLMGILWSENSTNFAIGSPFRLNHAFLFFFWASFIFNATSSLKVYVSFFVSLFTLMFFVGMYGTEIYTAILSAIEFAYNDRIISLIVVLLGLISALAAVLPLFRRTQP